MNDDVWNVPGPVLLGGALVALLLVPAVRWLLGGGRIRPGWAPDAEHLAYFSGGPGQAIMAGLAGLRAAGAVAVHPGGTLAVTGPVPPGSGPLTRAVYRAALNGAAVRDLPADPLVGPVLAQMRLTLVRTGWLLGGWRRAAIGCASLFVLGAAAGLGSALATLAAGWRIALGVAVAVAVGSAVLRHRAGARAVTHVLDVPTRAWRAARAAARLRADNPHLDPRAAPALRTYGAAGAVLAVALFGAAALWTWDPAFAAETGASLGAALGPDSAGQLTADHLVAELDGVPDGPDGVATCKGSGSCKADG